MPLLPLTQKLLLKRKKTIQHDEWGLNSLSTNLTESRQQTLQHIRVRYSQYDLQTIFAIEEESSPLLLNAITYKLNKYPLFRFRFLINTFKLKLYDLWIPFAARYYNIDLIFG
jgi:hypothetical protein